MALVPHKVVALAESDTGGKNIIAGAGVSLYNESGQATMLFDNAAGANGSTLKQTDAKGVVVVFVEPGVYEEQINGGQRRSVTVNSVVSVFGRTDKEIVAQSGDYESSKITNDSAQAGATVTDALNNIGSVAAAAWNPTNLPSPWNITNLPDPVNRSELNLLGDRPRIDLDNTLYLIAHRGFRDMFPQNTMIAMTSAIRRGAKALECDVSYSSQGTGYLYHDDTLDTLTDSTGTFTQSSDSTINAASITELAGTTFADTKIPLFDDFVRYASEAGVYIIPEVKAINSNADIDDMISIIEKYNMVEKTILSSFSLADMQYANTVNPLITVSIVGSSTAPATYESNIDSMAALGSGNWIVWEKGALISTPGILAYAKSQGVNVAAYTVNLVSEASALMTAGVRHIISDINLGTI